MKIQLASKITKNKSYKKPALQVLKFPSSLRFKNFYLFIFFILLLTQSILLFYFCSIHIRENNAIDGYKEALRFILREGGGFNYSCCNEYVMPTDPEIISLAQQLKTPENAFNFVANKISYRFEVTEDLLYPFVILNKGYSNCVGQANLLASLLIAQGNPTKNVWVVYGSIVLNKNRGNHAWVEFHYNNKWIVLDPTLLTFYRGFARNERVKFYSDYKIIPVIRYNNLNKYFISY